MNNSWDWITGYMAAAAMLGNNDSASSADWLGAIGSASASFFAALAAILSLLSIKKTMEVSLMNAKFALYDEISSLAKQQNEFSYKSQKVRLNLNIQNGATSEDLDNFTTICEEFSDNERKSIDDLLKLKDTYSEIRTSKDFRSLERLRIKTNAFRMGVFGYEANLNVLVIKSRDKGFLDKSFLL